MSELLYLLGSLDPLTRPLVFTVKQWAWAVGLTNPTPGRWVTNFTLTLLTLFYLQVVKRLPPVELLRIAAGYIIIIIILFYFIMFILPKQHLYLFLKNPL